MRRMDIDLELPAAGDASLQRTSDLHSPPKWRYKVPKTAFTSSAVAFTRASDTENVDIKRASCPAFLSFTIRKTFQQQIAYQHSKRKRKTFTHRLKPTPKVTIKMLDNTTTQEVTSGVMTVEVCLLPLSTLTLFPLASLTRPH